MQSQVHTMPSSSFCCQCSSSPHLDSFGPSKVQARLRYPFPESGEMQKSKKKIANLSLQAQHGGLARYILSVERRVARDKFVLQEEEQITTIRRTGTKKTKSSPELGWRRGAPSCSTSAGPPFDLPPSAGSPRASHPDQEKH